MHELTRLGSLRVSRSVPGKRVPVATRLRIGDTEIGAPCYPALLLVPENVTSLRKMWDALRMPTRNNLLVTGESGTGKTTLVRYLGEVYREVLRVHASEEPDPSRATHLRSRAGDFQTRILSFHENLRRSDIVERRHFGETGEAKTGWTMSDVLDGLVAGDWNVLSEINRSGEDIWAEFNDPLENKTKTLHQQVIRGHPDSRFIATINPYKSEGRGIYEGRVMSGEFMNRFTNKIHLAYLPPDEEFEVLAGFAPGVAHPVIDRLIGLASSLRSDYAEEHGVVPFPVTTRGLIRIVRHLQQFPDDASRLRALFWRKAYWLDDQIHSPLARKLIGDLLDLHDITDTAPPERRAGVVRDTGTGEILIGGAALRAGRGGPYVPDTVIEEVAQNVDDLEWLAKDMVLGENILLIGEAGVGKNKIESYLAHLVRANLLVIGMSGETRVSDLLTYRSFGEEEEGRTGDTATLGLRALTDPDDRWMIVLDEANKAEPGVLVSFNDLLQDRVVRLPGGKESPVRASIFVNINPNRPPYEVNDFSFEFMDRFAIHTIVHLPPDQAVEVLCRKYPGADSDFVRDVVGGFYALHPLYRGGILFEPVTMRNEETAIERGLQYPDHACNQIDLVIASYGPRDARERGAIRSTLEAAGFDRNSLAAAGALARFREGWESDPGDEKKARHLVRTYRAIGKPGAALGVIRDMISRRPERDWMWRLLGSQVLRGLGKGADADSELRGAFPRGSVIRLDNGGTYRVFRSAAGSTEGIPAISVEGCDTVSGRPVMITSPPDDPPARTIRRSSGTFTLAYADPANGLLVYERTGDSPGGEEPSGKGSTGRMPGEDSSRVVPVSSLVSEFIALVPAGLPGRDFTRQLCRLPSGLWTDPAYEGGSLSRELPGSAGTVVAESRAGGGWAIRLAGQVDESTETMVCWTGGSGGTPVLQIAMAGGDREEIPAMADPFVHLGFDRLTGTLWLVLSDDCSGRFPGGGLQGDAGGLKWGILGEPAYRSRVLLPVLETLRTRLLGIFRYAGPGTKENGAGDVMYTVRSDSGIEPAIVLDVDGTGEDLTDLRPGRAGADGTRTPWTTSPGAAVVRRLSIPFGMLDSCEARKEESSSPATQAYLGEVRRYLAPAFFSGTLPRDIAWEAKARANLVRYSRVAEPVTGIGDSVLSRGDILVRTGRAGEDDRRGVLVVDFVREERDRQGGGVSRLVRGFWPGEENPVATLPLGDVSAAFGRLAVSGDDRQAGIVSQFASACQVSGRPWEYSGSGNPVDPVVRFDCGGIRIEHHRMGRRFRLEMPWDDSILVIEETGYPADSATIATGRDPPARFDGRCLVRVLYLRDDDEITVILEDDPAAFLQDMPGAGNPAGIRIVPRSAAESSGLLEPDE